jgi:serine/threonine protein kinase
MILPSGDPMIMDFGIAKMETSRLTATGHFVGTPLYMSPEQALANRVDGRSDIFSLGSVLYESLTGVPAFAGETVTKILFQLISLEPAPPSSVVSSLTPAVDHILGRCLAKDAERRYRSARELSEDLGDVLEGRTPRSLIPASARATLPATPVSAIETLASGTAVAQTPAQFVATATGTGPTEPGRRDHVKWLIAAFGLVTLGVSLWSLDPFAEPDVELEPPEVIATATPIPTPTPTPDPLTTPTPLPARLVLDFEHTLREGTLRLFLDNRKVIDQPISGRITRKILGIEFRRGRVARNIEISPGRRTIRLQVAWDDDVRTEEIEGAFNAGDRLNLRARLGSIGGLRKNLSLDWN